MEIIQVIAELIDIWAEALQARTVTISMNDFSWRFVEYINWLMDFFARMFSYRSL